MINAVEEKEKELIKYKQILKKTDQDYQYLKQEHLDLKEMYEKAERDINKLLVKRENIANIQNLLLKLSNRDYDGFKENANRVLEDVKDLLNHNNTQSFEPPILQKTCKFFKFSFLYVIILKKKIIVKRTEIKKNENMSSQPKWAQILKKK